VVGGDLGADALEADGIEADERDREAGPPFLLELGEHAFLGDDEDAFASAALDEFGGEDAGFEGFAKADGIGDEDAGARLGEALEGRIELVGDEVHDGAVAQADELIVGDGAAEVAFEVEESGVEVGGGVGDEFSGGRVEDGDCAFEGGEEEGGVATDKVGNAVTGEEVAAIGGGVDTADEPFFVTDFNAGSGGEGRGGHWG